MTVCRRTGTLRGETASSPSCTTSPTSCTSRAVCRLFLAWVPLIQRKGIETHRKCHARVHHDQRVESEQQCWHSPKQRAVLS